MKGKQNNGENFVFTRIGWTMLQFAESKINYKSRRKKIKKKMTPLAKGDY